MHNPPANQFEAVKFVIELAPKDLTPIQRLVLIQIAHHYPNPELSQRTIAFECGLKRVDTVNKAIKALVQRGLLSCERQGVMRVNKYRLNYASAVYAKTVNMIYGQTVNMIYGQTGNHLYGQTVVKQTSNKQVNKQADVLDLFESFWVLYPRQENRKKAEQAFVRAIPNVSIEVLLTATRAYGESCKGVESKYVALPHSWLNDERWLDKPKGVVVDESWKEGLKK